MRKPSSSNYQNQQRLERACVLNDTLYRVSMRWKMQVLYSIAQGARSFGTLKRGLPGISDHVLGKRLRELQAEGLIAKPSGSTYAVTPRGEKLLSIMQDLCSWELAAISADSSWLSAS